MQQHKGRFSGPHPEGAAVGYRWFDRQQTQPLFPFGFGLSYTRFAHEDLRLDGGALGFLTRLPRLRFAALSLLKRCGGPTEAGPPEIRWNPAHSIGRVESFTWSNLQLKRSNFV